MRDVIGRYKFTTEQHKLAQTLNLDVPVWQYGGEQKGLPPRKFTVEEFVRMGEAGIIEPDGRVELIDGVIFEMAPIGKPHGARISIVLQALMDKVPRDFMKYSQSTIRLNDGSGPEPDIALLTPEASLDRENIPRPEDILLIIEIADSTLPRDQREKARRYAQSDIPELWIFVLASDEIEVSRQPTPEGYADVQTYRRGDTLTIQALPDVRLTVDELLA